MLGRLGLIAACGLIASLGAGPSFAAQWDFNTPTPPGTPPSGWENDSQAGSPPSYQVESFQDETALHIEAAANSWNRVKVRTIQTFEDGVYEWRVYVPSPWEEGASSAIGAFLYSPQSGSSVNVREIDFEIGYGRSEERAAYNIPAGRLMCYMTVQRDDVSSTPLSSIPYQPTDPDDHIEPGNWYTFTMELAEDALGRYRVSWYIEKEGQERVKGRPDFTAQYGPSGEFATEFRIHCSVENFPTLWIGDQQPQQKKEAWFDYVSFAPGDTVQPDPPSLPVISNMEPPDATAANFPPDPASPSFPGTILEGEWTRFGAAYAGISIIDSPAQAAEGDRYLSVNADWNAGTRVGVRCVPYGQPADWSEYNSLRFSLRSAGAAAGTTWQLAMFEQDGDIWITENNPVPADWTSQEVDFEDLIFAGSTGGDAQLDLTSVIMFGANFDNTMNAGAQELHLDDFRLSNPAGGAQGWFLIQ